MALLCRLVNVFQSLKEIFAFFLLIHNKSCEFDVCLSVHRCLCAQKKN